MSEYSTRDITREQAIQMIKECRELSQPNDLAAMTDGELDDELHKYVYSGDKKYEKVVGILYNYLIK